MENDIERANETLIALFNLWVETQGGNVDMAHYEAFSAGFNRGKFSPLGDNHHNAAKCPYCSPEQPSEISVNEEQLVEDIAADICDTVSQLNGIAYTPQQWMGTARKAIKHFNYHAPKREAVEVGIVLEIYQEIRDLLRNRTTVEGDDFSRILGFQNTLWKWLTDVKGMTPEFYKADRPNEIFTKIEDGVGK